MNVLVPVQDVVPVLLADISQAAADSLGGGEAVRVSIERLCNTIEGVLRTEFSIRVDRANAGLLLGGRLPPKVSREVNWSDTRGPKQTEAMVASAVAAAAAAKATAEANAAGAGDKRKRIADRWRRGRAWDRKGEDAKEGKLDGAPTTTTTTAALATAGAEGNRSGRLGGGGGGRGRSNDDDCAEEELVPLLQLVEELARDARFSPISNRDVVMSQVTTPHAMRHPGEGQGWVGGGRPIEVALARYLLAAPSFGLTPTYSIPVILPGSADLRLTRPNR